MIGRVETCGFCETTSWTSGLTAPFPSAKESTVAGYAPAWCLRIVEARWEGEDTWFAVALVEDDVGVAGVWANEDNRACDVACRPWWVEVYEWYWRFVVGCLGAENCFTATQRWHSFCSSFIAHSTVRSQQS